MAEAVAEEYRSSLADLNFNSKPHINMLTMLAEDNEQYAPLIVDTIVNHIKTVPSDLKLPSLYLVDSIMKNIGGKYIAQFSKHMIELFASVFEKVDEATRSALYKLRQTWNDILPKTILYGIDCRVNSIDPAWPITAQVTAKSIHVNPKFVSGPATAAQNLVKESEIKKKQDEMKKLIEEKAEKANMLRLIEEKKAQLKLLEAKKIHLQHAKQLKNMETALLKQKSLNQAVIHRDPRLKKAAALIASQMQNSSDKTAQSALQSIVVVPKTESKIQNTTTVSSLQIPVKSGNLPLNTVAKTPQPSRELTEPESNLTKTELLETNKNLLLPNKKRPLSSEESLRNESIKKSCRESPPLNNSKIKPAQNKEVHPLQENCGPKDLIESNINLAAHKQIEATKEKTVLQSTFEDKNKVPINTSERLPEVSLFLGTEDKDYRKLPQAVDVSKFQSEISKISSLSQKEIMSTNLSSEASRNLSEKNSSILVPEFPSKSVEISSQNKFLNPTVCTDLHSTVSPRDDLSVPITQSFKLDGKDRIIHFVNKRAFAFLDDKEPHEISFIGTPRNIFIDGLAQPLTLNFDNSIKEFDMGGKKNTVQFGTPARELYVNNQPYEIQFGGPPLVASLDNNKLHHIRVEGPPPQVLISEKPSYELYEAFNKMKNALPCPPDQSILSAGPTLPIQDVDMRVKNKPLKPPPFFESTAAKLKDIDWRPDSERPPAIWKELQVSNNISSLNQTTCSMSNVPFGTETFSAASFPRPNGSHSGLRPSLQRPPVDASFHCEPPRPIGPLLPPPSLPPALGSLPPVLSSLPPPPPLPNLPPVDVQPAEWKPLPPPPMFPANIAAPRVPLLPLPMPALPVISTSNSSTLPLPISQEPAPALPPPIPVGSLFEKLVAAGLVSKTDIPSTDVPIKTESEVKADVSAKVVKEEMVPQLELNAKSLKKFHPGVLTALYRGSQCATCGMRFRDSQQEQYKRHLDWHFRMNRREKDGAKKAFSRRLFYVKEDWIQFTEIEEAEERAPSYFELQADGITVRKEEEEKIQSVRASECETEKCSVCGEKFQLFWVEEEEEWHLRHAVRHDGEAYHPACFDDFKKASESTAAEANVSQGELSEDGNKDIEEKMEVDDSDAQPEDLKFPIKEEPVDESPDNDKEDASLPKIEPSEDNSEIPVIKEEPKEDPSEPSVSSETEENGGLSEIKVYIKDELLLGEEEAMETDDITPEKALDDDEKTEGVKEEVPCKTEDTGETDQTSLKVKTSESEEDEEKFRPPTPDPRFDIQPPVFKGTELSALCTIM